MVQVDSRASENRDAPGKPQQPAGRISRTASLPYRMHNSIKILEMNFKWYQPERWIPVEQSERFAKRGDIAGFLNRSTKASLIFFREHVVNGRFVGPHP